MSNLQKGFLITGYVWDNNQRSIANANVTDLQTKTQVTTNQDGYFEINVASMDDDLNFSHAAYDYDIIKAVDFKSYIELFPHSLPEVTIENNSKPKSSNTLAWVLGLGFAFIIGKQLLSKQTKTVKV